MTLIVSTERLGWPPLRAGLARFLPGEYQNGLVFAEEPERPTATCHLQVAAEETALCGYQWEGLATVPGAVAWEDLHPDLRCKECSLAAQRPLEDPAGRSYRYTFDR
jgi:deoxycytidylate deaminase